jgi:hypothetical protein
MVGEYLFVQVGSTTGTGVDVGTGTGVDVGTGIGVDVGMGTGVDVGTGTGVDVGTGTGVDVGTGTGVDVGTGTGVDVGTGTGVDVGAVAVILAAIISWSIASKVARMSRSGVGVFGTTIFSELDFDSSGKETQPITDKLSVIAMKRFLI